jgi:hypothetical protein
VRRALVLIGFAVLLGACGRAAPLPEAKPARVATHVEPSAPPVVVTGCHAQPSTVYGGEPVVFAIEGPVSSGQVAVELLDRQGQSVSRSLTNVPAEWRPVAVPSGDFELQVGQKRATCKVTVNRELSRGSETPR